MDGPSYQQRHLFEVDPTAALTKKEDQWFDRKSGRIAPLDLAKHLIGFANADGGTIVLGVEGGRLVGVEGQGKHAEALRQAALDFTLPPVRHTVSDLSCTDYKGESVTLMIFEVHPSEQVHRNKRGEVFLRVGDETRELAADAARELEYDKGVVQYDGSPLSNAELDDLDPALLTRFREAVSTERDLVTLLRARGLVFDRDGRLVVTPAAVLLFGHAPQRFFPNAHVRIIRYLGTSAGTGKNLNITLDRRLEGSLPEQIDTAHSFIGSQLREFTVLDETTTRFVVTSELPRLAWQETIVNAVTHRSYSMQGDHIRIRMFDDRLEIESPGVLPGPVRLDNIRRTRFSRNPRIARVLADLGFVRELNEGMNRIYQEMESAGLPEPVLSLPGSSFRIALHSQSERALDWRVAASALVASHVVPVIDYLVRVGRITTAEAGQLSSVSAPTVRRYLQELERHGLLLRVGSSTSDPKSYWQVPFSVRKVGRPAE